MLTPTNLQRQTLRLYGELVCRRTTWGGELLLTAGTACTATGLATATSIAGGTLLSIDPDAAQVKAVLRSGGLDFIVTTLDEALRVLKNELRQKRPLSVALIAPVQPTLQEMVERGVLPRMEISLTAPIDADTERALQALAATGMERLALSVQDGVAQPSAELSLWLGVRKWAETSPAITSLVELREHDQSLLQDLPPNDDIRRRWLQRIGHYQRPSVAAGRTVWQSY